MDHFSPRDLEYVIRVDEVVWGGALLAVTIVIHGVGMLLTLRATNAIKDRATEPRSRYPAVAMGILILAAWMIILTNLFEVMVWAGFFVWKEAQPNIFSAFYNALLNYTTLAAGYLPLRWRLLEGMLGMGGLITFAWSTSVLFTLAQEFMELALLPAAQRRERVRSRPAAAAHDRPGDSG